MRRAGAMTALVAVLDGTFAEIRQQVADPARFDRSWVASLADIWDNHTFPLFWAASHRTKRGRDCAAARVLARIWAWSGREHRVWMLGVLAAAGYQDPALAGDLDPAPSKPMRGYAGHLRPVPRPLDAGEWASLLLDYDLTDAEVAFFEIERSGHGRAGRLHLDVRRRYEDYVDTLGRDRASVMVSFSTVESFGFSMADSVRPTREIVVEAGLDGELTIASTSGDVAIRGRGASWYPDDPVWHRSAGALALAAETDRTERRPARDRLESALAPWPMGIRRWPNALASFLYGAALEIRSMRYGTNLHRAHVEALSTALAGVGVRSAAAVSHRRRRDREAASFAVLREIWEQASPDLRVLLRGTMFRMKPEDVAAVVGGDELPDSGAARTGGAEFLAGVDFDRGRIRYVKVDTERNEALVHLEGTRDGSPVIALIDLSGVTAVTAQGETGATVALAGTPEIRDGELVIPVVGGSPWRVRATGAKTWSDRALS